jgi:hypothetical protein
MYCEPFREVSAVNTGVPYPKVSIHRKLGFEHRQEPPRYLCIGRQHAVDDNGIPIGDTGHSPKAFVGLGKEGEAAELIEELLLQGLKLLRLNRPPVVVVQRHEEVIFFHQSQLPRGLAWWTPGSIR